MPCQPAAMNALFVSKGIVHVAEQRDGVVVDHHHPAVMRRGRDLEYVQGHDPTQLLRNLIHLEFHFAVAVDADHGGHVMRTYMIFAAHYRGYGSALEASSRCGSAICPDPFLRR